MISRAVVRGALFRWLNIQNSFPRKCSALHLKILVFLARLLPVLSFDFVSYGAGLTRVSLKIFTLSIRLGMTPPIFAIHSLGGNVPSWE